MAVEISKDGRKIPVAKKKGDGIEVNNSISKATGWSSDKIVETFCPKFEVQGNPVACHPVDKSPVSITASFTPIQSGTGDPSPDNVRPISGRTSVEVTRCGKNLLDSPNEITTSGYGNSGGWANNFIASNIVVDPNKEYIFSGTKTCSDNMEWWNYVVVFYSDEKVPEDIKSHEKIWNYIGKDQFIDIAAPFTPEKKYLHVTFGNIVNEDGVEGEGWLTFTNLQLELGSTPTAYEPYAGNTYPIDLGQNVYGGTVDIGTGIGRDETLFLSLAITDMNNNEEFPGWKNLPELVKVVGEGWNKSLTGDQVVSCNITPGATFSGKPALGVNTIRPVSSVIFLNIDTFGLTQSQWQEQYPDLVFQVCLKLAEPRPFTFSPVSIPTLKGQNTIYTDAGSLTVSGREDLAHAISRISQTISANEQSLNVLGGM